MNPCVGCWSNSWRSFTFSFCDSVQGSVVAPVILFFRLSVCLSNPTHACIGCMNVPSPLTMSSTGASQLAHGKVTTSHSKGLTSSPDSQRSGHSSHGSPFSSPTIDMLTAAVSSHVSHAAHVAHNGGGWVPSAPENTPVTGSPQSESPPGNTSLKG